jgi:hypothetical protein
VFPARYEISTIQEGHARKTKALVVVGRLANNLQVCEGSGKLTYQLHLLGSCGRKRRQLAAGHGQLFDGARPEDGHGRPRGLPQPVPLECLCQLARARLAPHLYGIFFVTPQIQEVLWVWALGMWLSHEQSNRSLHNHNGLMHSRLIPEICRTEKAGPDVSNLAARKFSCPSAVSSLTLQFRLALHSTQ